MAEISRACIILAWLIATLLLFRWLSGCAPHTERPPCSDASLEQLRNDCVARLVAVCDVPIAECPDAPAIEADCDRRMDEWRTCH